MKTSLGGGGGAVQMVLVLSAIVLSIKYIGNYLIC